MLLRTLPKCSQVPLVRRLQIKNPPPISKHARSQRHQRRSTLPEGVAQLVEDPLGFLAPALALTAHLVQRPGHIDLHQGVQNHLGPAAAAVCGSGCRSAAVCGTVRWLLARCLMVFGGTDVACKDLFQAAEYWGN